MKEVNIKSSQNLHKNRLYGALLTSLLLGKKLKFTMILKSDQTSQETSTPNLL